MELVEEQKANACSKNTDNNEIEFAAGLRSYRLAAIDVFLELDPLWSHFEGPGNKQNERQSQQQNQQYGLQDPVRCPKCIQR